MINRDFEYTRSSVLPNWMKEFANNELKKGGNPFEDINNLFRQRNDVLAVEERVKELRKRIGLDNINKNATIRHVEKAKERGEGTTTKWCVYPKNGGKSLGCHETRKGAEKQLQAIEINKIDDYYIQEVKDNIFGGLGDDEPDNKFDSEQLEKGIKVELEHTNDPDKAKEIAKDHLMESKDFRGSNGGKYYDKLDAMEEEFKEDLTNKAMLSRFIQIANKFEANGQIKNAMAVDELINIIAESFAKDKDVFTKYPKLQTIIDNICVSRGGFIDMPAVLHILQNEKDVKFSENDKEQLKEYINKRKNEFKKEVSDKDDFSGYVVFVINEDDGNNDIFNDLRG